MHSHIGIASTNMPTLSFKIAYPIIIAGFFIMVSFIALNYNNLNTSFYIVFAFLAVYVFLFGFAIGQNFTAPVKKLLKRANDLSDGDLKSRFYSESKDELGQLANTFNRIADQLEESNSENEKTKKSVGIKVEAETQSLREVINALEQKVQNRTLELQKIAGDFEKFKQSTMAHESELTELKNQVSELKEASRKRVPKKEEIETQIENKQEA
ncbi:MAG: hypothetical protein A3D44_02720 [Candidatus Staskawiczbacteria bacterium RIFCSPHIGHO2_02_FULL_42_22]|uniref:HAMP domain-containing protein n=1 Tax=Candidatus Staskawiczbacteria bacterium RIFCSPHIGHO2_02_FULL_42_22 TaxID=1802207 RepID=A0A1G2I5L9_9BACT|nr:MAG: hypothetical protein A3D44_02720 [Candidatus Staskawiczbacteria bacterium RIFCSPHIGHO2_02_FULL_42_22]